MRMNEQNTFIFIITLLQLNQGMNHKLFEQARKLGKQLGVSLIKNTEFVRDSSGFFKGYQEWNPLKAKIPSFRSYF